MVVSSYKGGNASTNLSVGRIHAVPTSCAGRKAGSTLCAVMLCVRGALLSLLIKRVSSYKQATSSPLFQSLS
jgi:hypothetical protein